MNLEFEFFYPIGPVVSVSLLSPDAHYYRSGAYIDTGAEVSIFDISVAERASIDLASGRDMIISGLGGGRVAGIIVPVTLRLLNEPGLEMSLSIAFGDTGEARLGNLIGLDVLEHFDFALSHRQRLGYLGRATP